MSPIDYDWILNTENDYNQLKRFDGLQLPETVKDITIETTVRNIITNFILICLNDHELTKFRWIAAETDVDEGNEITSWDDVWLRIGLVHITRNCELLKLYSFFSYCFNDFFK